MLSSLRRWLQRPHPFIYTPASILLPGVATFILIVMVVPWGFQDVSGSHRLLLGLGFGLASSLCVMGVAGGMRRWAPRLMQEESWTLGKEAGLILLVVQVICLLIFLTFWLGGWSNQSPGLLFLRVWGYTLGISLFPIVVMVLYEQYAHQRQKAREAEALNMLLRKQILPPPAGVPPSRIAFAAENGKVELQLPPEEVLFLKSEGNYVEIYYLDPDQQVRKQLIRNRLKTCLASLPETHFFHAHKSYVVNGQHVLRVEGNARNLSLILRGWHEPLPVSRARSAAISDFQ